ncbi:MAG: NAD-dependent epimerase/dehydratase family protein [Candidatus Kapabacteria bacterium]|nr:NAD-dependent epimerase/dehydratase family protein [Candidatus Kapabacteria bacterium]
MKIAVTGGAGFIGSHIVDAYCALGHEVVVLDNLSTGFRHNVHPSARFIECDICSHEIHDLFASEKFDIVNHHAAQIDVRVSVSNPLHDVSVNVLGTVNLLTAATTNHVGQFIFASSGGTVYGEQTVFPCDESQLTSPLSPYGVSKLSVEYYLRAFQETHGLRYVALRYANIFGPRQNPNGEAGVIAIFLRKLLLCEPTVINGDGLQTRDYVYIRDAVAANIQVLNAPQSGIYNISSGVEVSVVDIHTLLCKELGLDDAPDHTAAKHGEPRRVCLDATHILNDYEWSARTPFDEGVRETIAWFKTQYGTVGG